MLPSERQERWDRAALEEARFYARRSKDPSTKVGAVIADGEGRVISVGYNGFARGVVDSPERLANRPLKLRLTLHAELNAILFARRDLTGCTLYTYPLPPCAHCASMIVQCGVRRVVTVPLPPELQSRWGDDIELTRAVFAEAGVELIELVI